MAVVKANFVKKGRGERQRAKAHIRYIQHRHGKNKEKIIRALFGREGHLERSDAYRMIDEAGSRDNLFRFVISPHPTKEDNERDLNMRELTNRTIRTSATSFMAFQGQPLQRSFLTTR